MENMNDHTTSSEYENNGIEQVSEPVEQTSVEASESVTEATEHTHSSHHHHHSGHHHGSHSGHHHSGHHHRHRRSRHHRSGKKSDNKFLLFIKGHRSALVNIVACTLAIVMLILYATKQDGAHQPPIGGVDVPGQGTVRIESTFYTEDVALVNQAVLEYMNAEEGTTVSDVYRKYRNAYSRLDTGLPFVYSYGVSGLPEGCTVTQATLEISDVATFGGGTAYQFAPDATSIKVYNLLPATKYYYKLSLTLSNGALVGSIGDFQTVAAPRILYIDGLNNVRDIGGWSTESGKAVRYGLLFRGSELDGAVEPTYRITEAGMMEMIINLGIRTDMDLRYSEDRAPKLNALGHNVEYLYFPASMYSGIFNAESEAVIRDIFTELADESNYPMYMHCTYGRDRTGTVCYLLEALLGVSRQDLRREYDLSAFAGWISAEEYVAFSTRIELMEGATLSDKVEGYLLSIGVTQKEVDAIRTIFLEG